MNLNPESADSGSTGSAASVKSTSSKKLGSFRGNLSLKFKKKKSDSESEDAEGNKRKSLKRGEVASLKTGKGEIASVKAGKGGIALSAGGQSEIALSLGGDDVTSSTEQLDGGKVKSKGSFRKITLPKLSSKLSLKKESPPKDLVSTSPQSDGGLTTTEDDYSDARSNFQSAFSDSSVTSLPPSVEETETEFVDAKKSPGPDSPTYSQGSSTVSEQMLQSENRTPTPSSPLPKTPTKIKDQILSITTPISTQKETNVDAKLEEKPTTPGINGAKAGLVDKRELLFKILVIGELGTGKTSIIKRYVHQFFSQHYRATIGVDFALKILNYDSQTIIRLQLWDIAGQERFGNMTRVYYKEAVGAFIVYDVCRVATFEAVVKWKQDLDSKVMLPDGNPIPCILLANKCDQLKEGQASNSTKMDEFCKENKFAAWFETSARDNINIEEAAKALVTKILQNDSINHQSGKDMKSEERVALDNSETSKKFKCAC